MRKVVSLWLLATALLVVVPTPSDAWRQRGGGHGRVFISVGPAFWWYPYPYWSYPPPYYYYPPPPEEPPVYIEQSAQGSQAPPAYWYYCQSAGAYYPNVQSCPEAWIKVAPRTE